MTAPTKTIRHVKRNLRAEFAPSIRLPQLCPSRRQSGCHGALGGRRRRDAYLPRGRDRRNTWHLPPTVLLSASHEGDHPEGAAPDGSLTGVQPTIESPVGGSVADAAPGPFAPSTIGGDRQPGVARGAAAGSSGSGVTGLAY